MELQALLLPLADQPQLCASACGCRRRLGEQCSSDRQSSCVLVEFAVEKEQVGFRHRRHTIDSALNGDGS
jgi:hypothetical protein